MATMPAALVVRRSAHGADDDRLNTRGRGAAGRAPSALACPVAGETCGHSSFGHVGALLFGGDYYPSRLRPEPGNAQVSSPHSLRSRLVVSKTVSYRPAHQLIRR